MRKFSLALFLIVILGILVKECVPKNQYGYSKCKKESFSCGSGHCISIYLICDGIQHCPDGSDETASVCSAINCPSYMFRCNYGACVKISSICNGVADCADYSDEPPNNNCKIPSYIPNQITTKKTTTQIPSTTKIYTPFNPKTTPTPSPATSSNKEKTTPTPSTTKIYTPFNPKTKPTPTPTSSVTPPSKETTSTEASRSGWCQLPETTKDHTYSINDCERISNGTFCDYKAGQSVPPFTSLTLQCNPNYYSPVSDVTSTICVEDKWTPTVVPCDGCGLTNPQGAVNDNNIPWLVAIFDATKNFNVCWGTLTSVYTVITAAHCVFDETTKQKKDASNFFVMLGKHLTTDSEDDDTKRYKIANIHLVEDSFDGGLTNSRGNLAILEIDSKVSYNNNMKPVCVDWANKINFKPNDGTRGMVPIWTINLQLAMGELHPQEYIYVSNPYCKNIARTSRNILLSDDKFCIILDPGTVIDNGNGGNGYFVGSAKTDNLHLLGVVSSYFFDNVNTPMLVFTEITKYREKIKSIIDEIEERRRTSDIDIRLSNQSANKKPNKS